MPNQETDLSNVSAEVHAINLKISELADTKQNKIKPSVLIGFIIAIIGHGIAGIWGAATLSAEVKQLKQEIEKAGEDRFKGRDAAAMERFLLFQIAENRAEIQKKIEVQSQCDAKIRQLEIKLERALK